MAELQAWPRRHRPGQAAGAAIAPRVGARYCAGVPQENVDPLAEKASVLTTRISNQSDLEGLTTVLTAAFETDPLWSWAFPDPKDLTVWWRFCIGSALRYPCVWVSGDYAAASVWIPPDGTELTETEEEQVEPLINELIGPRAPLVLELIERFETSHPRQRPHYYLSLLGTHPDCRGQGLGMALLAENLASMDAEGVPTYLESSNPANNRRYERLGFRQVGEFTTPGGERTVATMWREVEGSPEGAGLPE
jgi:GNAT superfamily N-acetyltransferase